MNQSPQARTRDVEFCVLSFDGGGIRGLSSLFILRGVMERALDNTRDPIYPWKYFKIICGTSTGGLIALMLGRLRMSIDEAIDAYVRLGEDIFGLTKAWWKEGRYKATNLTKAIQRIVGEAERKNQEASNDQPAGKPNKGLLRKLVPRFLDKAAGEQKATDMARGQEVMMMDDRANSCKTFVCAMTASNLAWPTHFRTYDVTVNHVPDCKIWEAARATSAAPSFFKPMGITTQGIEMKYVDGGLRCNNPTRRLLKEMRLLELSNQRACILSIGTGKRDTINIPKVGGIPNLQLTDIIEALKKIATDCEAVAGDLGEDFADGTLPNDVYVRLNVEQGMQGMGLEEWTRFGEIEGQTRMYLRHPDVQAKVDTLKRHIKMRPGCE